MTTRVAIVGAGKIGTKHARVLHALPGADVSHVVDTQRDAAADLAERVDAAAVPLDEALTSSDAVYVCTPDDAHAESVRAAIETGLHTFVEKPLATDPDVAAELVELAAESNAVHMVGHILRFDSRYRQLQSAVNDGAVGDIRNISARRLVARGRARRTGAQSSPAMRLGVHDFDIFQWFAGEPLTAVSANDVDGALHAEGYDVADVVSVTGEFASGATMDLTIGFCLPDGHPSSVVDATIVGTEGVAQLDASGEETQIWDVDSGVYPDTNLWPEMSGRPGGALERESREYLAAIENDEESPVPLEAGRGAVAVAAAVERSIDIGGTVSVNR